MVDNHKQRGDKEMLIRKFLEGEEQQLMDIFSSSIRENAKLYYNEDQLKAWAPIEMDKNKWDERIRSINPYIIEDAGEILGYADLQVTGYIDHFFVKGGQANRGVGSQLMNYILLQAKESNLNELTADVSLAA